ncbi:MAG: hypothetical protein KAQ87_02930 [Candidatus Pacebacteria bacterium]|nr:hypothetical protein [Candidatus Paceibacterota bacterium]
MLKEIKKKIKNIKKKSVVVSKKSKTKKSKKIKTVKNKEINKKTRETIKKSKIKNIKKEEYLAEWTAPEFVRTREEIFWYYLSVGAAVLMIAWSLSQKNLIVVATFSLLIIVVIFQISRKPKNIKCKIDLDGIIIGDVIYKYDDIKSFEVIQNDDFDLLKFRLKNAILPVKEIQLAKQDPYYIRAALEYFLPEEKQEETLVGFENKNSADEEYLSDEDFYEYLKKNK